MTHMKTGRRYTLKSGAYEQSEQFDPQGVYRYAEPAEYADGCALGDCWITDERGNVHPGYNVSPVPIHASDLSCPRLIEGA